MLGAVSVIGVGNMGAALARTFLDAKHRVIVWNRTPQKAERLRSHGASVAGTAAEAVAATPLTVICVARYEHAVAALGTLGPTALEGRTIVNLTWGSPDDAEDMDAWVRARGGQYLDGGISVTPVWIGRPETELVYSGPSEAWARHASTLRVLGGASRHVGESIGDANGISMAIPGAFYNLAYGAFFESAAYAASRGVPPDTLRSLIKAALRLLEEELDEAIRATSAGDYENDQATLWIQYDALAQVVAAMEAQGQRATMTRALVEVLERGMNAGHGDAACPIIFPMLRDGG
jgi:3-hydroxyisobutyrate dehydrogenase-like beta-hydroxyacid dehydrogenase